MNDRTLAEQLRKTGNLLDLLNDETWVRQADSNNTAEEGTIEAGLGLQPYLTLLEETSADGPRIGGGYSHGLCLSLMRTLGKWVGMFPACL